MFNFQIKALKECNCDCVYCFEKDHLKDPRRLSLQDMEAIFRRARSYAKKNKIKKVSFNLTGGEPLLLGHEYLIFASRAMRHIYKGSGIKARLSIQTNATLIDEKYIKLFQRYRIGVSLSFDVFGGQRRFKDGRPAGPAVIDKMILLMKNGMDFGALVVINRNNYRSPQKMYKALKQANLSFQPLELHPWSYKECPQITISREKYINFMKGLAKVYLADKKPRIGISTLDVYKRLLLEGPGQARICTFCKNCQGGLVFIENNGEVYPCDTLRFKKFYLGNILKDPLERIMSSPVLQKLKGREHNIEVQCKKCRYVRICSGGCMAYAYMEGDIMHKSRNACRVYLAMFKYYENYLRKKGEKINFVSTRAGSSSEPLAQMPGAK